MKRILFVLLVLSVAMSSQAQHALQIDDGAGRYGIIQSNPLWPIGVTIFDLPPTGGTLVVAPPPGVPALMWLTDAAGNTLTDAGGGSTDPVERFGSDNFFDVVMMADGSEKMRMIAGGGVSFTNADLAIGGLSYIWPGLHGVGTRVLSNDGLGNLSWTAGYVTSVAGTANQVLVNGGTAAQTGAVILSAPQNIHTGATPTFSGMTLSSFGTAGVVHNAAGGLLSSSLVVSADIQDGTIATIDIGNDQVTYAKLQNMTSSRLLGRTTAAAGDVEEISTNATLSLTALTLGLNLGNANSWTALQTFSSVDINGGAIDGTAVGATTPSTGAFTTLSATGAIDFNMGLGVVHSDAGGVLSSSAVVTGDIQDGTIATIDIGNDQVTYAKLQNMTSSRLLGRTTAAAGDVEEISTNATLTLSALTLGINLSNGNTWVGNQLLPANATQGDNLIASINTGATTINAARIGNGLTDAQVLNNLTIDGGTINSTPIGATTPSTGAFTTLSATGAIDFNMGLGVVHSDAGGVLTSSAVVPADLAPGAANTFLTTDGSSVVAWTGFNADATLVGNGIAIALGLNLTSNNAWVGNQLLPANATQGDNLIASINTGAATINAARIGNGLTDAQVLNNLTIDGGTINSTPIGATTPSTGAFTTLSATGAVDLNLGLGVVHSDAGGLLSSSLITTGDITPGASPSILITNGVGVVTWAAPVLSATFFTGNSVTSTLDLVTGDVTSTDITVTGGTNRIVGAGNITLAIANDAVTFAKMQNINTARLLGRTTAAAGDVEEISTNATLTLSALTLGLNLANANTWTVTQTFGDVIINNNLDMTLGDINNTGNIIMTGISSITNTGVNVRINDNLEIIANNNLLFNGATANISNAGGDVIVGDNLVVNTLGAGVVHSSAGGLLSSSPVVLTSEVSGVLPVANGGTGVDASGVTGGQILIGHDANNNFSLATITAGAGISVTNGDGSITIAATGGSGLSIAEFTANDAWVVPAGVTHVKIEAYGAGGGGGGGGGDGAFGGENGQGGGGGGGGVYSYRVHTVTAGETLTITIGAGGTAGTAGSSTGGNGGTGGTGGTTTVVGSTSGTLVSAAGGDGGEFGEGEDNNGNSNGGAGAGGNTNLGAGIDDGDNGTAGAADNFGGAGGTGGYPGGGNGGQGGIDAGADDAGDAGVAGQSGYVRITWN